MEPHELDRVDGHDAAVDPTVGARPLGGPGRLGRRDSPGRPSPAKGARAAVRGSSVPLHHDVLFSPGPGRLADDGLSGGSAAGGTGFRTSRIAVIGVLLAAAVALGSLAFAALREIAAASAAEPGTGRATPADHFDFRGLARAFLSAATPDEKLAMLRVASGDASSVRDFYRGRPTAAHEIQAIAPLQCAGFPAGCVAVFYAYLDGGDERIVAIVEDDDGRHRVDWGAFARVEPMSWEEFGRELNAGSSTADAEFRLLVTESDYYNRAFTSEGDWVSYQLRRPDRDGDVFGYVQRDSELARELRERVGGGVAQRLILGLRGNANSVRHHQFLITGIVSTEWVR